MRASSTRISMADVLTQLHISRQGDWVFTHSVRLNTMQNQLRHDKWACQNASQDRKSSNFWFFPHKALFGLWLRTQFPGEEGDLSECVTQTSKFFQTQMIKQKSSLRPNLRVEKKSWIWGEEKKNLKSIKSWLAANCSLNNSSFWKRLFLLEL